MEGTYEEGFKDAVQEFDDAISSALRKNGGGNTGLELSNTMFGVIQHVHYMKSRNFEGPSMPSDEIEKFNEFLEGMLSTKFVTIKGGK